MTDAPYQETDRISPHFGHMIQPLDEGVWICLSCDYDEDDEGGEG